MQMTTLSSIADYATDKISSNDISLNEYVTTDCILQNKKGREIATNLPPQPCSLTHYKRGDVLIAISDHILKKFGLQILMVELRQMFWCSEQRKDIHQVSFMLYYFKMLFLTM